VYKDLYIDAANLTVNGNTKTYGAALNVAQSIDNNQINGYSSLYFSGTSGTPVRNEKAQIFTGNGYGLNLTTLTNHNIAFKTFTDEVGATNSMQILGTGTRDVEILAPLKIKSSLTLIDNAVTINGTLTCSNINPIGSGGILFKKLDGTTAVKVFDSGACQCFENLIADKNLTVNGTTLINSADKIVFNISYGAPTLLTRSAGI
jgi:hypothetical protein